MIKEIVPNLLVYLTLISDVVIVALIVYAVSMKLKRNYFSYTRFGRFLRNNSILFGLIVSLTATLGSLFYSEIMNYTPCVLCWYQRIFMYPQVFIFALALWKKDRRIFPYSILLSIIGVLIAAYHYILQVGFVENSFVCDVVGYSAACTETFFTNIGYITIPMMALTAFVLLVILGLSVRRQ